MNAILGNTDLLLWMPLNVNQFLKEHTRLGQPVNRPCVHQDGMRIVLARYQANARAHVWRDDTVHITELSILWLVHTLAVLGDTVSMASSKVYVAGNGQPGTFVPQELPKIINRRVVLPPVFAQSAQTTITKFPRDIILFRNQRRRVYERGKENVREDIFVSKENASSARQVVMVILMVLQAKRALENAGADICVIKEAPLPLVHHVVITIPDITVLRG